MRKVCIVMLILVLLAAGYIGSGLGAEAEAPGYEGEAPGYGEEAPGYAEQPPVVVMPGESAPISAAPGQPKSIDELIMWYDSSSCKECHSEIYEAWEKSHHARSLMGLNDLVFMGPILKRGHLAVKNPKDATRRNFPCFKCHLPQAMNAADPVFQQIARAILAKDKKVLRKLNINCLVCHNQMAIIHKLLYGEPEIGVVYGTQDIPEHEDETYTKVKKSVIMTRSVMCGQCHGLGPNLEFENPVQCATLFGSYMHSYIPEGGHRTCQECHMQGGDHSCPPDFNRKKETSARLAQSIKLDVETLGYQVLTPQRKYVPVAAVHTRITSAAGHRVPDG